jgi:hypothetical protein
MKLFGVPFMTKEFALKAVLQWQSITKLPYEELKNVHINEIPYRPKEDGEWEHLYLVIYGGTTDFLSYNAWDEVFLQPYATEETSIIRISPKQVCMYYSLEIQKGDNKEEWFIESEFTEDLVRLGGINHKALEQISEFKEQNKEPK